MVVRGAGVLLAVTSAVLHGASLSVLAVAMAAACLYCAYELGRFDSVRSWLLVAVMNIAMIGVHLPMVGHHGHPAAAAATAMGSATVVAAAEILLAAAVLYARTRAPG
ncbi:hypothetical protein [Mycobacterium sp. NAZ190054]|uniref:hypothetical protein n=1 Tax=Mycobacterium sp. NAZ190054 TaxID=1747766 RepID=UPI00079BE3CC|nr:hypothetical protein [Mycobacterium sp. NAZ190054]KWX66164.1 hypothetical protein ASJ79_26455 [Mycobacterium sp. NAZ190054]